MAKKNYFEIYVDLYQELDNRACYLNWQYETTAGGGTVYLCQRYGEPEKAFHLWDPAERKALQQLLDESWEASNAAYEALEAEDDRYEQFREESEQDDFLDRLEEERLALAGG